MKNDEKITLTLYFSDILKSLGIGGAEQTVGYVKDAFNKVNKQNQDRLEIQVVNPLSSSDAENYAKKYVRK